MVSSIENQHRKERRKEEKKENKQGTWGESLSIISVPTLIKRYISHIDYNYHSMVHDSVQGAALFISCIIFVGDYFHIYKCSELTLDTILRMLFLLTT